MSNGSEWGRQIADHLEEFTGGDLTPEGVEKAFQRDAENEQRSLSRGVRLPKEIMFDDRDAKEIYKKAGIQIEREADDLFFTARLPEGWAVEPATHYMWSRLLDDQQRHRADIFYKPESYDRQANLKLFTRFSFSVVGKDVPGEFRKVLSLKFNDEAGEGFEVGEIKTISRNRQDPADAEKIEYADDEYVERHRKVFKHADDLCENRLSRREIGKILCQVFPDYRDGTAYWDENLEAQKALLKEKLEKFMERTQKAEGPWVVPGSSFSEKATSKAISLFDKLSL